jgi:hypothetical protein
MSEMISDPIAFGVCGVLLGIVLGYVAGLMTAL